MGEAKRRKQLDCDYGKKQYSLEFLDYQSWKAQCPEEIMEEIIDDFEELEAIKFSYEKLLWGVNVIIKDISNTLTLKLYMHDDDDSLGIEFLLPPIKNKRHEVIIERNRDQIQDEIFSRVKSKFDELIDEEFLDEEREQRT